MDWLNWLHQNAGPLIDLAAMLATGAVYVAHRIGKVKHSLWIDTIAGELDKLRSEVNGVSSHSVAQLLSFQGFKSRRR